MQGTPCTVANGCDQYDPDAPQDGGLLGVNYFASFWPLPLPGWCDPGRCEKFDVSVADGVENLRSALEDISNLDPVESPEPAANADGSEGAEQAAA